VVRLFLSYFSLGPSWSACPCTHRLAPNRRGKDGQGPQNSINQRRSNQPHRGNDPGRLPPTKLKLGTPVPPTTKRPRSSRPATDRSAKWRSSW